MLMDSNRENFDRTQNFLAKEQLFLESVRSGRDRLKERIEGVKNRFNTQLDRVFDTLNEKTLEV